MLILQEKGGERLVPIQMSTKRASMLMVQLHMRPLMQDMPFSLSAPDIYQSILNHFDIQVKYVQITGVKGGNFFCDIVSERAGEPYTCYACQANDGMVVAVTSHCPILIEEELLQGQYMHKIKNGFALNINTVTRSMLEDALAAAIANENYEAASLIRDELAKRPAPDDACGQ